MTRPHPVHADNSESDEAVLLPDLRAVAKWALWAWSEGERSLGAPGLLGERLELGRSGEPAERGEPARRASGYDEVTYPGDTPTRRESHVVQILAFGKRGDVPASSHLPQFYTRPDQAVDIAAGLFSGHPFPHRDRCVCIGPVSLGERIEGRLAALGVRVADLKAAGQFCALDERPESPDRDGFDPSRLLADHLRLLDEARKDGFVGVRLVIELSWLVEAPASPAQLLEYEALCDAVFSFQRQPIVAIAQYDAARLGERLAGDLVKLHPIVYTGRYLKHNPNYPPMGPGGAGPSAPIAPVASQPRPRGPRAGDTAASA